jgi:preprotein translocase SecE subunit
VQDSYYELKRVRWPSREETVRLTTAVIGFSVAVGVFLGALDALFAELVKLLVPVR